MKKKRIIALIALLATPMLWAQNTIDERLEVRLVELDVRVVDLAGNPVTGLTADDFTVRDAGRQRSIDSFEEVVVSDVPREYAAMYIPRTMFLIDFENTKHADARRIFPQLRSLVRAGGLAEMEMGLAVNANGVQLLSDFTTDKAGFLDAIDLAEEMYAGKRNRWSYVNNRLTGPTTSDSGNIGEAEYLAEHYRNNMQALRKFVNYLGTYHGKKNLIVFSDIWLTLTASSGNVSVTGFDLLHLGSLQDLKAIQTASIFGKVTINVINPRPRAPDGRARIDTDYQGGSNNQKDYVGLTGGFQFFPSQSGIGIAAKKMVDLSRSYYRIRYYAESDRNRFRPVTVTAKGVNRIAYNTGGYYGSGVKDLTNQVQVETSRRMPLELAFDIPTDWAEWTPVSLRKYQATLVVGQRAFDDMGRLLMEKLTPITLTKKGYRTAAPLSGTLEFNVPGGGVARVEAVVVDTTSGKRIRLQESGAPDT